MAKREALQWRLRGRKAYSLFPDLLFLRREIRGDFDVDYHAGVQNRLKSVGQLILV